MKSPQYALTQQDMNKWVHNSLVFSIPVLIVIITESVGLIPDDYQHGALILYFSNILIDLLKKWKSENVYK